MSPKCCAIVVGVVLALGPTTSAQQPAEGQYLIESVGGVWQVREKGKDRPLAEKYDVITTASQVRCMKMPCTLQYSTDGQPKSLFAKPPVLEQWLRVPAPTEPPVARSATDLQLLIGSAGVRGGANKGSSTCGGDLPVIAPRCDEMLDPLDFSLRWTPRPADAGKTYSLFVGATDSSDRRRFSGLSADAGEFQSKAVQEYLVGLQKPDHPVDVTLRLMRTESLDAVRLVLVPGTAEETEYRRVLRSLDRLAELPRNLGYMEEYLKMRMWSKAAGVARTLLQSAPDSLEMKKYALIGFCASDFSEETAKLRNALRDAGVTGICEVGGAK